MKKLTLAIAFLFSVSANASFYQISCSNADGTTTSANGHVENFLKVTKFTYQGNEAVKEIIDLDKIDTVEVAYSNDQLIERKTTDGCPASWISWQETRVVSISITNKDGSLFDKGIVGVSQDLKSINTHLICQEDGNSMVFCPQN